MLRTMFAAIVLAGISAASVVVAVEGVTVPVRHLQILPDPDERGVVFGENITVPVITPVATTRGTFSIRAPGSNVVTIRPYRTYTGSVWARKVDFGADLGSVYVTAPLGRYAFGDIKVYDMFGSKVAVEKIGGKYARTGIRADIAVDSATNEVILAAGAKSGSAAIALFAITPVGSVLLQQLAMPAKATNVRVSILAADGTTRVLATPNARLATLRSWEFSPETNNFRTQTEIQQSAFRITQQGVALK